MTKRMPRAQRRAQLIRIATAEFGERGFNGTSMEEIASAAGITKPVLYQHFVSKEAMYVAVINAIGEYLDQQISHYSDSDTRTEARVRNGVVMYFDLVSHQHGTMQLFFGQHRVSDSVKAEIQHVQAEAAARLGEVFASARSLELETALTLGHLFIGAVQSAAHRYACAEPEVRERAINETTQLLSYGLASFGTPSTSSLTSLRDQEDARQGENASAGSAGRAPGDQPAHDASTTAAE